MDARVLLPAIDGAFRKLNPRTLMRNPVMFVVAVVSALTSVLFVKDLVTGSGNLGFSLQIIIWLWFTVLFANFAEAPKAEARRRPIRCARRAPRARPSC
jgi:K+-transporting ATPase ATPase B chain